MKAACLIQDRTFEVRDIPKPVIKDDEVLIEVQFASICGTDQHIFNGEFKDRVAYPAILGHEFSGAVVEFGKEVNDLAVGQVVVVDPVNQCGRCPACLLGKRSGCKDLKLTGIDIPGAFAQFVRAKRKNVFEVPGSVSPKEAALTEIYAIGMHATIRARINPADIVVILGMGKLGLAILDNIAQTSASMIIVTDVDDYKLDIARTIGAHITINASREDPLARVMSITNNRGADKVIEAVGHAVLTGAMRQPMTDACQMICSGGKVVVLGQGPEMEPVFWKPFVIKEGEIIASRVNLGEFPRTLQFLSEGRYHPGLLCSREMSIDDIQNAFELLENKGEYIVKIILHF